MSQRVRVAPRAAWLVCVLALGTILASGPAAEGAASTQDEEVFSEVCDLAGRLSQEDSAAAIELILAARSTETPGASQTRRTACQEELDAAIASRAFNTKLELSAGGACLAARALLDSGRSDAAKRILEGSSSPQDARKGCPTLFGKTGALPDAADGPTPKTLGTAWDGFVENSLTPLAPTGLFLIGSWAALLVLARLLVFLPRMRDRHDSTRMLRREHSIVGVVLLFAAPLLAWMSVTVGAPWSQLLFAIFLGGVGGFGAWMIGRVIATMPRLSVEITGDGDKTIDRSVVAATIRDMMGIGAMGIEIPVGPDLDNLSDALTQLSDKKWIAALQKAWLFVTNARPWALTLGLNSQDVASVSIDRNGRQVHSALIKAEYGRAGEEPDEGQYSDGERIVAFAAGDLVAVMAERYPEMREKLHGAKIGKSIALQYISAKGYALREHRGAALQLLGKSLDSDPGNTAAVLTIWYREFRDDSERLRLMEYRSWLLDFCGQRTGINFWTLSEPLDGMSEHWAKDDLLCRALATLSAVNRNLLALPEESPSTPSPLAITRFLDALLVKRGDLGVVDEGLATRKRLVKIDLQHFAGTPIGAEDTDHDAPIAAYSLACHYAQMSKSAPGTNSLRTQSLRLLARAFTNADLKDWAERDDPELEPLRGWPAFEQLFERERDPRLSRAPFLASSVKLNKSATVATLESLAATDVNEALAAEVEIPMVELCSLQEAARIAVLYDRKPLDGFEWAALEWLYAEGSLSAASLRDAANDGRGAELFADLATRGFAGAEVDVRAWLSTLSESLTS
ncbi:hypothetical protein [Diaminobutyricimonas sp. LJ205]|uniref:hypothetical protein n=1 Tax=Diaminobutyricimonas sp. LJ205 TaxID=2683590 RepID=UPI0012F49185|nr:hypothetical protein [Diaminobutyricimonas sp. LJ205]